MLASQFTLFFCSVSLVSICVYVGYLAGTHSVVPAYPAPKVSHPEWNEPDFTELRDYLNNIEANVNYAMIELKSLGHLEEE